MLKIRLQRVGRIHEPSFRIVLTDSKNGPKSGKFLEILGSYDPREGKGKNSIKAERVKELISKGAQLSETMHNFLVDQKVISGKKINVLPKNKIINANKVKKAKEAEELAKDAPKPEIKAEEKPAEPIPEATPEVKTEETPKA